MQWTIGKQYTPNKHEWWSMQFDIKEICPSISENALKDAMKFAKEITPTYKEDEHLINKCRI